MSPQSRANDTENTTFEASGYDNGYGWSSGNACSSPSSVVEIAWAASASFTLHEIESTVSDVEQNPLGQHASIRCGNAPASISLRKRKSSFVSTNSSEETTHQPFLSSYGSAFLSGIFADIAQVSEPPSQETSDIDEPNKPTGTTANRDNTDYFEPYLPCKKKSRATHPTTSFGGHTKSYMVLAGLTSEGAVSAMSSTSSSSMSPHVVSPRLNESAIKIQLFNDQVRELQDLAFPSLPQIPVAVSSSSCSSAVLAVGNVVTPRYCVAEETEPTEAYGWFVSTDDDEDKKDPVAAPMYIPNTDACLAFKAAPMYVPNTDAGIAFKAAPMYVPNTDAGLAFKAAPMYVPNTDAGLAFKASVAPRAEHHDLEVQQALAADTIDDVLGDFF